MNRRTVGAEIVKERVIARATYAQSRRRRELVVQTAQHGVRMAREVLVDVKGRVWTVVDEGLRRAFEAVAAEEMDSVSDNRASKGPADLLIRIRQHTMGDEIRGVELVVAEVTAERAGEYVRARLGDGVHDHAGRMPLRRIEPVRKHLEFRNRIAIESWLLRIGRRMVDG